VSDDGLVVSASSGMLTPDNLSDFTTVSLSSHPYSFPEFQDVDGSTQDYSMASSVGAALTESLNTAINMVLKPVSTEGRKTLNLTDTGSFFKIAVAVSNSAYNALASGASTSSKVGELEWTIKPATAEDMKSVKGVQQGLTVNDYVVVVNHTGGKVVVPYSIPKGYSEGQQLYGQQATSIAKNTITSKLSWGHVVYMASAQYNKGSTVQNPSLLNKEDAFSKMVGKFLDNLFGGLRTMLGLFSTEELMFNAGNRGATYYYGIFPMSWLNPINTLNIFATVISLIIIGIAIVKLLIQRNMATITPSARADLMDGVRDLFVVMVGIALFMPIMYIILNFNNTIVTALRNLSPSGTTLGLTTGAGGFGIVETVLQIAFFFILITLNITYIIRAVTLALLIGLAPMFISMFGAGPAMKKISVT